MAYDDYLNNYELSAFGDVGQVTSTPSPSSSAFSFKNTLGIPLFSGTKVGENGAKTSHTGLANYGLAAWNAYNSWNQGNKMYDLQKEAFDFNKENAQQNMAMMWDQYKRKTTANNVFAASKKLAADLGRQPTAQEAAALAEQYDMNTSQIQTPTGGYNIVNLNNDVLDPSYTAGNTGTRQAEPTTANAAAANNANVNNQTRSAFQKAGFSKRSVDSTVDRDKKRNTTL